MIDAYCGGFREVMVDIDGKGQEERDEMLLVVLLVVL
jgi:hypothetical protein